MNQCLNGGGQTKVGDLSKCRQITPLSLCGSNCPERHIFQKRIVYTMKYIDKHTVKYEQSA